MSFKQLLLVSSFVLCIKLNAQTTAIPDVNFEQRLIDLMIDTNGLNGNILDSDAQAVTNLTLTGNTISNFTGLEAFVNVVNLNLGNNSFATVPLSNLTLLETLKINDNDLLASLDVSQNVLLKNIDIESDTSLNINIPSITTLDLSNNVALESVRIVSFNNLSNVILPVTPTLTSINITRIADPTLDFSLISGLETLIISSSFVPVTITLPNVYTNLNVLTIQSIDIPLIDISNYINLEQISFSNTGVETLLLPNSTTLTRITISSHNLQGIQNFASLPNLERLSITNNENTPLLVNVTQNLALTDINLSSNDMSVLDLTQNVLLEDINISNNEFTTIDLTQNVLLEDLNVSSNNLPTLNVTQNVLLEYLYASNNLLPNLDVTNNVELRQIIISNNLFTTTGLDLTQNVELNYIDISNNQVESLYILDNVKLVSFVAHHNLFSGTDILDQLFIVKSGYFGVSASNVIDVSFNNLSGPMPNFASLVGTNANYFRFYFHNNAFEFGHFEDQHSQFVNFLTQTNTFGSVQLPIMTQYWYAPQAKVNTIDTINANAGDAITLTTVVSGAQNHYVWFKDGVQIPGAPDSPNYVINNVNSCDIGVYHSEIRSDLVPFDNANAPGTSGKNLLLVRNDITLNVAYTSSCVTLNAPANGATNIPINSGISWNGNSGACGYFISIGTTPGGTDLVNNVDVGDVTNYNLGTNFPSNTQIYVTITPYFQTGPALVCPSESFTTSATTVLPDCTQLSFPSLFATDVPIDSNLSWNASLNATGYFITIGTTSGGTEIVNMLDVGNTTTYNPTNDFPDGAQIYVTIIPYNNLGNATGCGEESFTTFSNVPLPTCTTLTLPLNNATNVPVNSNISWNAVSNATGYFISYGTNNAANNIENMVDVGNVLTYNPPTDFPDDTIIYVVIITYNSAGNAVGCNLEYFETEVIVPNCTTLVSPLNNATNIPINSNISWNAVTNATGYFISYGTNNTANNIESMVDVGNVLTYNPPTDFPDETIIYVTITPYNSAENAVGCSIESFETEVVLPVCTTLSSPLNNATNVSISSNISWNAVSNATGYFISYGTNNAANNIENMVDVGNALNYNPPTDFPDDTIIYVVIIPYNSAGNAVGCNLENFETEVIVPNCTTLVSPLNNATNVSINSNISWNTVSNATGYFISYGTNTAGNDLVNMFDVGNVLTYNPPTDFPDETIIYVTITPYNSAGNAVGCSIESFETEVVLPVCTTLTSPLNNAINVPVNSNISWNAVSNATGYFISIGSTSGGTDIANMINVSSNTYNPSNNFPDETIIYVTIIPYNSLGNAVGCSEESFETEVIIPNCTTLTSPLNNAINVSVTSNISWNAVSNATGYFISYGTNNVANNIENMVDVGNVLTYNPPTDFPDDDLIYVKITPYNAAGSSMNCSIERFETEIIAPVCTSLIFPQNGAVNVEVDANISWNFISNATGYFISIGTSPTGNEIANMIDVGNTTFYNPPTNFPDEAIIYVTITPYNSIGNALGGCASESFKIQNRQIIVPAFFTPNGDEFNDVWKIYDPKNEAKSIAIFDRYGKLIYYSLNVDNGWNGKLGNQNVVATDYWFVIERKNGAPLKGHFSIKR